jgi:hypothetical protein
VGGEFGQRQGHSCSSSAAVRSHGEGSPAFDLGSKVCGTPVRGSARSQRWSGWHRLARWREGSDLVVYSVREKANGVLRWSFYSLVQRRAAGFDREQFRDVLMEGDEAITGIDGRLPKPKL